MEWPLPMLTLFKLWFKYRLNYRCKEVEIMQEHTYTITNYVLLRESET